MPQLNLAGRPAEDAATAELIELINKRGFSGRAFPMFHIRTPQGHSLSKPDFEVADGGVHIGSAKLGAAKEFLAFKTAQEYSVVLPLAAEMQSRHLGEVFAVTYPAGRSEKYSLHILARAGKHDEIGLVLDTLDEVADSVLRAIKGEFAEVVSRAEPAGQEARRLLNYAAESLAGELKGVPVKDLESVFGGHGFFHSVLEGQLPKEKRELTLRLGAAFLFVNQVLFYTLLSKENLEHDIESFPPITHDIAEDPERIQDFFDAVYQKDYEPIYGISITQFMKNQSARDACAGVVRSIIAMAPKLDAPDLAGQIFQTLIPFDLRKPLGAHYTNPGAAMLLARFGLQDKNATVLDPACGSGTLLIAAYKRLFQLNQGARREELHRTLVEDRITGIDVMAFSAHLAAVGLALQQPLNETNLVRIGRTDSTRLVPGSLVIPTEDALASEFQQGTLDQEYSSHEVERRHPGKMKGPVKLGPKEPKPFKMEPVDLLIMNPPFTSWENMAEDYRNELRHRFKLDLGGLVQFRPSQQLFFLLLAERFIKDGKRLAAVLPLTTFTAHAFHPWVEHFLKTWTVKQIIVGLARASFSEDTSLTECLVVADKHIPPADSRFMLIGTKKLPSDLTTEDIEAIVERVDQMENSSDDLAVTKVMPQASLLPSSLTLAGVSLSLHPDYERAILTWMKVQAKSELPFVQFEGLLEGGRVDITGGIRTGEHLSFYGNKALIACRSEERMYGKVDRLVFDTQSETKIVLKDILGNRKYTFQRKALRPALRRFSFIRSLDVTDGADFCVFVPASPLDELMERMYGPKLAKKYLRRIRKESMKYPDGRWRGRVMVSSGEICLMRRLDLASPNTTVTCVWSEQPLLPACEGYAIQGTSPSEGKLLTMWYNSTPFLLLLLAHSTLTRGTWLKLEDFAVKVLPAPDASRLSSSQIETINQTFDRANVISWPSLLEQLRSGFEGRKLIDDLLLQLAGVESSAERVKLAEAFRIGARVALEALLNTMGGAGTDENDQDE